jgi:hypothetical protein
MKVIEDRSQNLYIYIHTNDHTPAHVHVFKGTKNERNIYEIKINIGNENEPPSIVKANPNMASKDVIAARNLVIINQQTLLEKWNKIHGVQKLGKSSQRSRT